MRFKLGPGYQKNKIPLTKSEKERKGFFNVGHNVS